MKGKSCESDTCAVDEAEACGPGQSLDGKTSSDSISITGAVKLWPPMDGLASPLPAEISQQSTGILSQSAGWIALQRDFLARISAQQDHKQASMAARPAQRGADACEQLSILDLPGSSLKTAPESNHTGQSSGESSAKEDMTPEMEHLMPPTLAHRISADVGSCSQLGPTLLAADCRTIAPSSSRRLLPTLCATDYKSPYSAEGYRKQAAKRSKPLRDTAAHTIGIRLTPDFCEWWMGWPIGASASRPLGTLGCHCKPLQPG